MIKWAVISFFSALLIHLYFDYRRHLSGKLINHKKEWYRTVIWGALASVSVFFFAKVREHPVLISALLSSLLVLSWYIFIFNGFYNVVRGFKWFYSGTNWEGASVVTKFFIWIGMFA